MGSLGKSLALLLVALFLMSLIIVLPVTVKATFSRTIVVPNDFRTIREAMANATQGDTILVKGGTYNESAINTNKSLSIMGEGSQSTILNLVASSHEEVVDVLGEKYAVYDPAIMINANDFTLSGFTINSNGGEISIAGNKTQITNNKISTAFADIGYYLDIMNNIFTNDFSVGANYSKISANNLVDKNEGNGVGISGLYDTITNNVISGAPIDIAGTSCLISSNTMENSGDFFILSGSNNIVSKNIISHFGFGLTVYGTNNTIFLNQITHCGEALRPSQNNMFYANYIANNGWAIDTQNTPINPSGNATVLFHNNFVNNLYSVNTIAYLNKTDYFDDGKEGNYWSDFHGVDANGDGIGDTPYIIDSNRSDRYPLMSPFNISNVPDLIPDWSLPPLIEIINPTNSNYPNGNVTLDFSVNKQPLWIDYCLDGIENTSTSGNLTLTNLSIGKHNITVYATDSYQNTGVSTTIVFTVEKSESFQLAIVVAIASIALVSILTSLLLYRRRHQVKKL